MNGRAYRLADKALWESVGLQPSEQRIRLAHIDTEVRLQEVGDGPPVLFIHGGPNAGSTWARLIEFLPGFRCLVVDRPGTGLSDPYPVTHATIEGYASGFVAATLDALDIEKAHVVASSFGGMIALRSAAATPERFERMVQMACPAFAPGMLTPPFMRLISLGFVRRLLGALPPNPKANESILRQIGHGASLDAGRIPDSFKDWYTALMEHTDTMANDGEMIGRAVSLLRGFDRSLTLPDSMLARVTVPTLFLWGEDDGFGGEDVARALVAKIPNAELIMLEESGHLPWLDFPKEVAHESVTFLSKDG